MLIRVALRTLAVATGTSAAWLLAVLLGSLRRSSAKPASPASIHTVVLIPAHDEEASIGSTLVALEAQDVRRDVFEVVVIAHNCSDRTAAISRGAGATVWERTASDERGKGAALAFAFSQIAAAPDRPGCVIVLDADCDASPNLVRAIEGRVAAGAAAVQVRNVVANPEASGASALRAAAILLMNVVRPRGLDGLGLSAGLRGTGMGFRADLVTRMSWSADSLAEDLEQQLRLVELGERVEFADEAEVRSALPASPQERRRQFTRWEGGRLALLLGPVRHAVARGVRERRPELVLAALDTAIPPQANLMALSSGLLVAGALARDRPTIRLAAISVFAQAAFILAGLRVADAPPSAYRALLQSPALVLEKARVYASIGREGLPAWRRAAR